MRFILLLFSCMIISQLFSQVQSISTFQDLEAMLKLSPLEFENRIESLGYQLTSCDDLEFSYEKDENSFTANYGYSEDGYFFYVFSDRMFYLESEAFIKSKNSGFVFFEKSGQDDLPDVLEYYVKDQKLGVIFGTTGEDEEFRYVIGFAPFEP